MDLHDFKDLVTQGMSIIFYMMNIKLRLNVDMIIQIGLSV